MANEKESRQVVRAFFAAMEKMDFDQGLRWVADDIEYINSPGVTVRGPQGIRQVLVPFFEPIEENQFVILREVVEGDTVVVERLDRHRIGDVWFELPVTGVIEVRDGKMTYWREYFDVATITEAMTRVLQR